MWRPRGCGRGAGGALEGEGCGPRLAPLFSAPLERRKGGPVAPPGPLPASGTAPSGKSSAVVCKSFACSPAWEKSEVMNI